MIKNDGSQCIYIDYCELNKAMFQNKYSLPRINDLSDWLMGATHFSKIDLWFIIND